MEQDKETKAAIAKIADAVNAKRRRELIYLYRNRIPLKEALAQARSEGVFAKGSKNKVWRKVASMPLEVDIFFSKIYGKDYYKDKSFFRKHAPEWSTISKKDW